MTLDREDLEACAILDRAVEAARPVLDEKGHAIAVIRPREPAYVSADAGRIEQVLLTLLTNAARHTPSGGRVSASVEAAGGEVVFRVRDSGVGIDPQVIGRIFDPFSQAERGLERAEGGLGIGLTVAKSLVELHGGRIAASSEGTGRGSEFRVVLPAVSVPARTAARIAAPAGIPDPPRRRVLVVDDHADSGEMLATLLELWGHEVQLAKDGQAALEVADRIAPDVVLLDIGLPILNGFEVARRLKCNPRTADALLVAVTGYGQDADRARALEAGFTRHLVKPVSPEMLREALLPGPPPSPGSMEP